jgi:hypothetical protein
LRLHPLKSLRHARNFFAQIANYRAFFVPAWRTDFDYADRLVSKYQVLGLRDIRWKHGGSRRGLVCLRSPKIDHFLRWLFSKPPRNAERIANAGKMISQSLEIIWNGEEWTPKSRRRET